MTNYQIRLVILDNLKDTALTLSEIYNLFPKGVLGVTITLREMSEAGELISGSIANINYYTV